MGEALRNNPREKEETPPLENDYFKEVCLSSLSFSKMLYLSMDVCMLMIHQKLIIFANHEYMKRSVHENLRHNIFSNINNHTTKSMFMQIYNAGN